MGVPYDYFTKAFLHKVTEHGFMRLKQYERDDIVNGYFTRACAQFNKICKYDLLDTDEMVREIKTDIPDEDIDEIIDIVSEGMLVQWFKQYMYKAENFENLLNTADFTSYSPAELLYRITNAYDSAKRDFINMMREYSYNHGDLSDLSL